MHSPIAEPGLNTDTLLPAVLDATWTSRALLLSEEAGWNQNAADWNLFFKHGKVLGFCVGERLVATAAALPYGPRLGWISMVLVTSDFRRRGLAKRLVAICTSTLRDAGRAALLDATPAGASMYTALGFRPLCTMERWSGQGSGTSETTAAAESINLQLDEPAFGADRLFVLEDFLSRPGTVPIHSARGFAIVRQGSSFSHIGPIVGEPGAAESLLTQGIRAAQGRVVVDVLAAGDKLQTALAAQGFVRQRCFTRMGLGIEALPGDPARLLAAAGPEFG